MKPISDNDIIGRVKLGCPDSGYMRTFAELDRRLSGQFRDPGGDGLLVEDDDGDSSVEVLKDTAISGISTQLQTNIYTKIAAIAINDPDWHIVLQEGAPTEYADILRVFLREMWRKRGWKRVFQKALMKRYTSGLGIVCCWWDAEEGARFDVVHAWDFSCDPRSGCFQDIPWAARRLRMTVREAIEWFGRKHFSDYSPEKLDDARIPLWVYWDDNTEAVIFKDQVIRRSDNLYGRLPFLFLLGDLEPGGAAFPVGDMQLAAGHSKELEDLTAMVSNIARNGRAINMIVEGMLSKSFEETLANGIETGWVPLKDFPKDAYIRVPAEDMSPALLEAINMTRRELDSITGVTQFQRGVIDTNVRFATEAAMLGQQSGSRAVAARVEYETFLEQASERVLQMLRDFGGPTYDESGNLLMTEEEQILWEASMSWQEIQVVEGSSLYKDQAQDQQQSMQLLNLMLQTLPVCVQLGLPYPNITRFIQDVLRSFGKRNMNDYFITPEPVSPADASGGIAGGVPDASTTG